MMVEHYKFHTLQKTRRVVGKVCLRAMHQAQTSNFEDYLGDMLTGLCGMNNEYIQQHLLSDRDSASRKLEYALCTSMY